MCYEDIYDVFDRFVRGKVPRLPWYAQTLNTKPKTLNPQHQSLKTEP